MAFWHLESQGRLSGWVKLARTWRDFSLVGLAKPLVEVSGLVPRFTLAGS